MYREGERDPFQLSYWTRPTILCQEALTLYIYPQLRQHQNLWSQTHHTRAVLKNMLFFHACCELAIALNLESQKPLCNLLVACARSKSEIY